MPRTRISAGQEMYFFKYFSKPCSFIFPLSFLSLNGLSGDLFSGTLVLMMDGLEPEGIGSSWQRLV